jgi:hypothetical protein
MTEEEKRKNLGEKEKGSFGKKKRWIESRETEGKRGCSDWVMESILIRVEISKERE